MHSLIWYHQRLILGNRAKKENILIYTIHVAAVAGEDVNTKFAQTNDCSSGILYLENYQPSYVFKKASAYDAHIYWKNYLCT